MLSQVDKTETFAIHCIAKSILWKKEIPIKALCQLDSLEGNSVNSYMYSAEFQNTCLDGHFMLHQGFSWDGNLFSDAQLSVLPWEFPDFKLHDTPEVSPTDRRLTFVVCTIIHHPSMVC